MEKSWINTWGELDDGKETFVLAECSIWEAQIARDVYQYGQVIVLLKKDYRENAAKYLGEKSLNNGECLIKLIDFISQVMKASLNCCQKIYLASMGEGNSLGVHFHLLPRSMDDFKESEEKEGYFLMHDLVRKYNQNHLKYSTESQINCNFVPPSKKNTKEGVWHDYALKCKMDFQNGYERIDKSLKNDWPPKDIQK